MDAPPPNENCRPFVTIAGYLASMGLNVPQILGADFAAGFVLMTDLGSTQYLDALTNEPACADELYAEAINALVLLQNNGVAYQARLPDYDAAFIELELKIFRDWLCERHLGVKFSAVDEQHWQDCCARLAASALEQQRVFMHRDFHSRNLMLTAENNPGILDFQDAVQGPLTYDIVSLLKDCYIEWPGDRVRQWALGFYEQLVASRKSALSADRFMRQFDLMGMQRHLKAAGIFARLLHRDGKAGYLKDIPRTLAYIADTAGQYPELGFLAELVAGRILPALHRSA
jgi:hypothetical protein